MNKEYFNALVQDRKESADTLEKPSMRGVKSSVIDKYTDQAHFVYELLQNADDVEAEYTRFKLYHDKLVFAHNGERHFSVSSPGNEEWDRENGALGDVNAILSIGNSSKTSGNTIGKFGVGFKSVFQYTSTPEIYDPEIRFKIERFIVPVLLESDYDEREEDETLFVLPFNHDVNTPDKAFEAISDRLWSLVNPLLFLSCLKKIDFEIDDTKGSYQKEIVKEYDFDDTNAKCINLSKLIDEQCENAKLWLFSRMDENGRIYSVGFFLNEDEKLCPVQQYAYCFFPTREETGLNFIIHAPFLLTDSREGIKQGEDHNKRMIDLLADLAADSLVYLRDIGNQAGVRLLDDNILNIIPTHSLHKDHWLGTMLSPYEPFYIKILNTFKTKQIIPIKGSYTIAENAYWAQNHKIRSVFDDESLQVLMNNHDAHWVFTTLARETKNHNYYIDKIIDTKWFDEDKILNKINKAFIESRTIEWLAEFYAWIDETSNRIKKCKTLPVFLDRKGNAVPSHDQEGKLVLFLPADEDSDYTTINDTLLENEDIKAFLINTIRMTKPALKHEIYNKILPKFKKGGNFDSKADFKKLFEYYMNECPPVEQDGYISELQKYNIARYTTAEETGCYRGNPRTESIYFPTEELNKYFETKLSTKFVTINDYTELVGKDNEKILRSFLIKLGVSERIQIVDKTMTRSEALNRKQGWNRSNGKDEWSEKIIDGCSENIKSIVTRKNTEKSVYFWNTMVALVTRENIDLNKELKGWHIYHYRKWYKESFDSINVSELRASKWLYTKSGEFVSPSETYATALAEGYDVSTSAAKQFISFLKMPVENPELSRLSPEQKRDVEIARKIKDAGIPVKKIDEVIALYLQSEKSLENSNDSYEIEDSRIFSYEDNEVYHEEENFIQTNSKSLCLQSTARYF